MFSCCLGDRSPSPPPPKPSTEPVHIVPFSPGSPSDQENPLRVIAKRVPSSELSQEASSLPQTSTSIIQERANQKNPHAEAFAFLIQQTRLSQEIKDLFVQRAIDAVFEYIEKERDNIEKKGEQQSLRLQWDSHKIVIKYFPPVSLRDQKPHSRGAHRGFFAIRVVHQHDRGGSKITSLLIKIPRPEKPFTQLTPLIDLRAYYPQEKKWIWLNEKRAVRPDFQDIRPKIFYTQFNECHNGGTVYYLQQVVQEYCFPSLCDYIHREIYPEKDMGKKTCTIIQVAIAVLMKLQSLCQLGYSHRDIKPDNVVIGSEGEVKLIDFGLISASNARVINGRGSLGYKAPECIVRIEDSSAEKVDVFAVGILIYQMLRGRYLYGKEQEITRVMLKGKANRWLRERLGPLYNHPLEPILEGMLDMKPSCRLDIAGSLRLLNRCLEHLLHQR